MKAARTHYPFTHSRGTFEWFGPGLTAKPPVLLQREPIGHARDVISDYTRHRHFVTRRFHVSMPLCRQELRSRHEHRKQCLDGSFNLSPHIQNLRCTIHTVKKKFPYDPLPLLEGSGKPDHGFSGLTDIGGAIGDQFRESPRRFRDQILNHQAEEPAQRLVPTPGSVKAQMQTVDNGKASVEQRQIREFIR